MASRLKKIRSEKNLSQRELSRIAGIEQATLSRIERGEMSLLSPHVATLARALGVTVPKLLGIVSNITPSQVGSRRIPIMSYKQIGKSLSFTPLAEELEMTDFVRVDLPHSADTFATRIEGDSMENVFSEGDVVVIDPDIHAQPGDFVVAVDDTGTTTFRRYRDLGVNKDGNRIFELIPLNSLYASLRSDQQFTTIKGVMVEHRKYRRAK